VADVKALYSKQLLGLTGGIGSGKSTVGAILQELGATVVDADVISRSVTAFGGPAIPSIRVTFGDDFVDNTGALDRAKMRKLVFSNVDAKQRLETIVHPLINAEMEQQIQAATSSIVVLELPLLAEKTSFSSWRSRLNRVCVVDCLESTQIARVVARSGMTAEQVQAILNNQASRQARLAIADVVIVNEELSLAALKEVVKAVIIAS
jgi:dephospho-CoA kinase